MESSKAVMPNPLLLARLEAVLNTSGREGSLTNAFQQRPKAHEVGTQISLDSGGVQRACIISSGWAYRSTIIPDGRHQIFSVLLPGDIVSDGSSDRPLSKAPITALTRVGTINATSIFALLEADPKRYHMLATGLNSLTRAEEAHLLGHVVRLGCQSALERLAHLLLELHDRLDTIGFVHQGSFTLPMSQELLGNMLGLSLVHINRTLKELKRRGLISTSGKVMIVIDYDGLAQTAGCLPFASLARSAQGGGGSPSEQAAA